MMLKSKKQELAELISSAVQAEVTELKREMRNTLGADVSQFRQQVREQLDERLLKERMDVALFAVESIQNDFHFMVRNPFVQSAVDMLKAARREI